MKYTAICEVYQNQNAMINNKKMWTKEEKWYSGQIA